MNPPEQQPGNVEHPSKNETFLDLAIKSLADNRLDKNEKEELNRIIREYNEAVEENRTETREKLAELRNENDLKEVIKKSDGYIRAYDKSRGLNTKEIKDIQSKLGIKKDGIFGINTYITYKNKYPLNEFPDISTQSPSEVSSNPENEDSSSQSRNAPPENSKTNEVTTHKEFLKLPFGERLEVVTEGNVKLEDVLNGSIKNIKFSFPSKELENKVKLQDLIPKESIVRQGLYRYSWNSNGYFSKTQINRIDKSIKIPKNNQIKIQNGTELSFKKPDFDFESENDRDEKNKIISDLMTYLIPTYFKEEDINGPKKLKEILSRKSYPTEDKTDKTKLSKECKILFLCALKLAGLPGERATSKEFKKLICKEAIASTGDNKGELEIGILNYTIPRYKGKSYSLEQFKRNAVENPKKQNPIGSKSTASGLGQLLLYNVDIHYPNGREGIGVPLEEAIGMVRYIKAGYGNPKNALNHHTTHNRY